MAAGHVAIQHGLRGPSHAASTACATGAHAIGDAYKLIRDGDADMMLAGATEGSINRLSVAGFCRLKALSTSFNGIPSEASRPFDSQRDGFVIGEGAAVLCLEEEGAARARGANILAYVRGVGLSCDASHITAPSSDGSGALRAMEAALRNGGMAAKDVDYVNAHATSTPLGDDIEGRAMESLFAGRTLVSSTKGHTGHLLGAAGALEAALTVFALNSGLLPATRNLLDPSQTYFNWKHVPRPLEEGGAHKPAEAPKVALCNSFGFGGTNASLLFSTGPPLE